MNGYKCEKFIFEGKNARVILPDKVKNGRWALKTEYADAFMDTELELLSRGYCIAFIENDSRWGLESDLARKSRFIKYISENYGLNNKCALIGMSCGGLMAIKQASYAPEDIACLYLDAPVLNYYSCPCGFGAGEALDNGNGVRELMSDLGMKSISELLIYTDMPMHKLDTLTENKLPVIMVAGGSDLIVPYEENGIILECKYRKTDIPFELYIKKNCGHHPHGHDDVKVTADFIDKYYL